MRFAYHLSLKRAAAVRSLYCRTLARSAVASLHVAKPLPLSVYAFSSEADLPEQVASIRSFLSNAGRPERFVVVSDGSHSSKSQTVLRSIDECVDVVDHADFRKPNLPRNVLEHAADHPFGKKLTTEMSLPVETLTIYSDADVLFFPGSREHLLTLAVSDDNRPQYLASCLPAFDNRLFRSERERNHAVNAGFIVLREPLDWSVGLERLSTLDGRPSFFTEQTVVHLTLHANQAHALNSNYYVLALDDQFKWRDPYRATSLCMRHYVSPVRHKFWLCTQQDFTRTAGALNTRIASQIGSRFRLSRALP